MFAVTEDIQRGIGQDYWRRLETYICVVYEPIGVVQSTQDDDNDLYQIRLYVNDVCVRVSSRRQDIKNRKRRTCYTNFMLKYS